MRAVIYARYSSENQREASLADQVELCRRFIERQGWTLAETYEDAAQSGASRFRPGFARLATDAESGKFDILVCEALDRLSRKLSDIADLHDRLTFRGIAIHTTSSGLITPMHVGIMGTMAQMTLADLREKTRRGQLGRARAGRIPGGLAYGYAVVPPPPGVREAGERRIDAAQAAIVRRIFRDYAAGKSPRHIARALNAEKIPGPGGRPWGDTTIRGQVDRGTGVLNNSLYVGRLEWNRCSYVKDPRTGQRVARNNAAADREIVAVPELRIIDDTLWQAVKARQAQTHFEITRTEAGHALNRAHRRKFLLSGLLRCGCCGGGYTIMAKDRYGCAAHRARSTCSNGTTILRQRLESRVLSGLKERMLEPDLVAEFIKAFAEEVTALQREAVSASARHQADLAETTRRIDGLMRAIENGAWNDSIQKRLTELEARKAELEATFTQASGAPPILHLHPNAADIYRTRVAELETALNDPSIATEAIEAIGALIDKVELTPDASSPDGMTITLHGDLAMILHLATERRRGSGRSGDSMRKPSGTCVHEGFAGSQLSVVAGTGFEPVTFRL